MNLIWAKRNYKMGLRFEDLKGMLIPLIGVDKFQPKTGTESEVIVVSFVIKEEQAAKDLEQFLEMSAVNTLDTEASPNPDEDGHYVVFAEFKRDSDFWATFKLLLRDVENVAGDIRWMVDPYKAGKLFKMNDPELNSIIITDQTEYEFRIKPEEEQEDPEFADVAESLLAHHGMEFKAYTGKHEEMMNRFRLNEHAIDSNTSYEQRVLNTYIGTSYKINNMYVKERADTITVYRRA